MRGVEPKIPMHTGLFSADAICNGPVSPEINQSAPAEIAADSSNEYSPAITVIFS